jgi:hypothetical protein
MFCLRVRRGGFSMQHSPGNQRIVDSQKHTVIASEPRQSCPSRLSQRPCCSYDHAAMYRRSRMASVSPDCNHAAQDAEPSRSSSSPLVCRFVIRLHCMPVCVCDLQAQFTLILPVDANRTWPIGCYASPVLALDIAQPHPCQCVSRQPRNQHAPHAQSYSDRGLMP